MIRFSVILITGLLASGNFSCKFVQAAELLVPNEYITIQSAIDVADNGDTVIVADGTYMGVGNCNIDFDGKEILVRSENGPDNCVISFERLQETSDDSSMLFLDIGGLFHFHNGEDSNSIIDGFTITSDYYFPRYAIWCDQASPMIRNCRIIKNSIGIYCENSNPIINNCILTDNIGGIYCENSAPKIERCIIQNNGKEQYKL